MKANISESVALMWIAGRIVLKSQTQDIVNKWEKPDQKLL